MINDGTIKEVLANYADLFIAKEDQGYGLIYKPRPTIVSTDISAFRLNEVSEFEQTEGTMYVDRVLLDKNLSKTQINNIVRAMLTAFKDNEVMSNLDIVSLTFQRPGPNTIYLKEVENDNSKFELRLYAKGYPKL